MEQNQKNVDESEHKVESVSSLIGALQQDFATSVRKIYIHSLGKELAFREITASEQKTLSRIMVDNNTRNRKDVVFDAQLALLQKICLDKTFNPYDLLEVDRLILLMSVYQANMFKENVKFTCEECGAENVYKLDFEAVLDKLQNIDVSDKTTTYENKNIKYTFKVGYPTVNKVLAFYKNNALKYRGANKHEAQSLDKLTNIDYLNLYVSDIDIEIKATGVKKHIKMSDYRISDIEQIISVFPQDVFYSEDGIIRFIVDNFVKVINDAFEVQKCFSCGAVYENAVSSAESFL